MLGTYHYGIADDKWIKDSGRLVQNRNVFELGMQLAGRRETKKDVESPKEEKKRVARRLAS